jgi:hypothetical protein
MPSDNNTRYVAIVRDTSRCTGPRQLVCDFEVIQSDVTNNLLYRTNGLA